MLLNYRSFEIVRAAPGMLLNYWAFRGPTPAPFDLRGTPTTDGIPAPSGFPTQYAGFEVRKAGSTIELCLVATVDAPAGMGGQVRLSKNGTVYAAYLVETSDSNASPVRVQTTTGIKALRLKT